MMRVTNPACGTPAAPMLAKVAVTLNKIKQFVHKVVELTFVLTAINYELDELLYGNCHWLHSKVSKTDSIIKIRKLRVPKAWS